MVENGTRTKNGKKRGQEHQPRGKKAIIKYVKKKKLRKKDNIKQRRGGK